MIYNNILEFPKTFFDFLSICECAQNYVKIPVVPGRAGAEVSKRAMSIRNQWPESMSVKRRSNVWSRLRGAQVIQWAHGFWHANDMTWKQMKSLTWKNKCANAWRSEWTNGWINEWRNEGVKEWMSETMFQWMDDRIEEMNESTSQRMDKWMNEWTHPWWCE
jgi:hypothetical protein